MKGKRVIPLLLSLMMLGGAFAGCSNGNNPEGEGGGDDHTHTYAPTYTSGGESGHYHLATCHPEEHDQAVPHVYDANYKCLICDYQHTHVWSQTYIADKKGKGHYLTTTCEGHDVIKGEMKDHVFDNDMDATCSDCTYVRVPPHTHTWGNDYENEGEKGHTQKSSCADHEPVKSDYFSHVFDDASDMTCPCGYTREADTSTPLAAGNKIYVVGDSTVCSFSDSYYLPRYGYGTQLHEYLNVQENQIVNLAISGRSSLSYLTEDNYATLKSSIGAGDYLIIGFGHNDEKSDDKARFTDPAGTLTQESTAKGKSLKYNFYNNYIKVAEDAGATAILCTPIVRYSSGGTYSGNKIHVTSDGDYAQAIKELGEETHTAVVDLTGITKALYEADNTEAQYYHAHTTYIGDKPKETPSGRDDTHINEYGAKVIAYNFAKALKETDCTLKAHVITNALAPTKGTDYAAAVNAKYVKPDYKGFSPSVNSGNKLTEGWYKTVMGEVGGSDTTKNFTITYANETFTIGSKEDKGKIAGGESGVDGFPAAFMQIDATKNFKASATVKIIGLGSGEKIANSQSAFGMMLRDDIYLGKTSKDGLILNSNYVAAGAFAKTNGAIFARENGELKYEKNNVTVEVGSTFEVSIERVGQVVTVKFDSFAKTYTDFDFLAVDDEYMYLCLFATRNITAEFTNVKFEETGISQGA